MSDIDSKSNKSDNDDSTIARISINITKGFFKQTGELTADKTYDLLTDEIDATDNKVVKRILNNSLSGVKGLKIINAHGDTVAEVIVAVRNRDPEEILKIAYVNTVSAVAERLITSWFMPQLISLSNMVPLLTYSKYAAVTGAVILKIVAYVVSLEIANSSWNNHIRPDSEQWQAFLSELTGVSSSVSIYTGNNRAVSAYNQKQNDEIIERMTWQVGSDFARIYTGKPYEEIFGGPYNISEYMRDNYSAECYAFRQLTLCLYVVGFLDSRLSGQTGKSVQGNITCYADNKLSVLLFPAAGNNGYTASQ